MKKFTFILIVTLVTISCCFNAINLVNGAINELYPSVSSASRIRTSSKLIGVNTTVDLIDFYTDRELYVTSGRFCRPLLNDAVDQQCACNYADSDSCGSAVPPVGVNCQCDASFCTRESWTKVEDGDSLDQAINYLDVQRHRFFLQGQVRGVEISVESFSGDVMVAICSNNPNCSPMPGQFDALIIDSEYKKTICPGEGFYTTGTYFINVYSKTAKHSQYHLHVNTFDVDMNAPTPTSATCAASDNGCVLSAGQPMHVDLSATNGGVSQHLSYTTDKCQRVLISQEIQQDVSANGLYLSLSTDHQDPLAANGFSQGYTLLYGSSTVIALCYPPTTSNDETITLYMSIGNVVSEGETQGSVYVTITPVDELPVSDWEETRLDQLPLSQTSNNRIRGAFELVCESGEPDSANNQTSVFGCMPGATLLFQDSCHAFFPVLHSERLNYFYPMAPQLAFFDVEKFDIPFSQSSVNDGNRISSSQRLSSVVFLELLDNTQRILPISEDVSIQRQCHIRFPTMSPVSAANHHTVSGDYTFTEDGDIELVEPECVLEEWQDLSQQLVNYESVVGDPDVSTTRAYIARFQYDLSTFSQPWIGCQIFASSYLLTDVQRLQFLETARCLGDPNDPCCNRDQSWTECCHKRDFNVFVEALSIVDEEKVSLYCEESACTSELLEDFSFFRIFTGEEDGCRDILPDNFDVNKFAQLSFYRECKEYAFGRGDSSPNEQGKILCTSNADCPGENSICSRVNRQCILDREEQENLFFQCLQDNIPVPLQAIVQAELLALTLAPPDTQLSQLLKLVAGQREDCVSSFTPYTPYTRRFQRTALFPLCSPCPVDCLDGSCSLVAACEERRPRGRENGLCSFFWTQDETVDRTVCESQQVCNYDASLTDEAACERKIGGQDSFFCGFCEDGTHCEEFSQFTAQHVCEARTLCIYPDGTQTTSLTTQQCQAFVGCDSPCVSADGKTCDTQQNCEFEGGECVDRESVWSVLNTHPKVVELLPEGQQALEGVCVFPMNPFNRPDCSRELQHVYDYPSNRGCLRFILCDETNQNDCELVYQDRETCLDAGGLWQTPSSTKEDCLVLSQCIEPNSASLGSPKDGNECRACFGNVQSTSEWREGEWFNARAYQLEWRKREMVTLYDYTETVDFVLLQQLFENAVTTSVRSQLRTELSCAFGPQQVLLDSIVCACRSDPAVQFDEDSDSSYSCFERGSLAIGVGVPCFGDSFFITAPPTTVETTSDSFPSDATAGTCAPFTLELINARELNPDTAPPITTFAERPDDNAGRFEYVLNGNDARVGQAIGDGVVLSFTSDTVLNELRLCLDQKGDIPIDLDKYPVPDFGYRVGDKLRPYGIPVEIDEKGFVCAVVTVDGESQSYMPIIRIDDWEDEETEQFTDGQRVLLYIVAVLFTLVALACVIEILLVIRYQKGFQIKHATNLLFVFFFVYSTIRAVYFYLFASGVFEDQDDITEYILVELPTFLYLGAIMLITISFSFTLLREKHQNIYSPRTFWAAFATAMFLLAAFFITIVLIFQFVVLDEDDDSSSDDLCSLIVGVDNTDDSARTVRLIYQSIVAAIAFTIFVTLSAIGITVWRKTTNQQYGSNKMLKLVIIASASVLADSVAFIIYYAVDEPSPYFTIALIFTEVLPTFFMIYLLHPKTPSNFSGSSTSGSHHRADSSQ